jgi:hypothetical protein
LLPRRQPSLFTPRLICLTTHGGNFKFNLTYVWSKCELFVWNRCRGMRKALLLWCMQEIGGDCLWPASPVHKENEPAMMKAEDWDCIIGAQSKSQSGESPRCVRYSLNVVRLFIISDRERNKQTARLTDKFSLSRSQSTKVPSTINYAIVQTWLCFKWNTVFAKSVLTSKYYSSFSLQRLRRSRGSVMAFGTQVRGFTPGQSRWMFRAKKILSTPSVPCRSFTACKTSLNVMCESAFRQNYRTFLTHSSTFRRWVLSLGDTRGDVWWQKLERLTKIAQ